MDRTVPDTAALGPALLRMPVLGRRTIVWLALGFNCALWYGAAMLIMQLLRA